MSRTRYIASCHSGCGAIPLTELGKPCPICHASLSDGRQVRTPYVGGELVGAYPTGPKDNPWPVIKDGPQRGQTIVPSLSALKKYDRNVTWQ